MSGSELVITDFTDFCDVHNVRLVDDFLSVFSGAFRIELDNCSAETESFLGHETILGITSSDITKILYVINSFSDCSHLSLFDVNPDYNIEVIVDWLHYQHPVSPTQMHSLAEKHHAPKNSGKVLQLDANNYIGDFLEKAIEVGFNFNLKKIRTFYFFSFFKFKVELSSPQNAIIIILI